MDALGIFKKDAMKDGKIAYRAGDVTLVPETMWGKRNEIKTVDVIEMSDLIKPFDLHDTSIKKVFINRAGGLGDLIALSSLCHKLRDYEIHFYTQKLFYGDVFDWFKTKPIAHDHIEPLITGYKFAHRVAGRYKSMAFADINGIIEKSAHENWYEVFYKQCGMAMHPCEGRPQLVTELPEKFKNYVTTFERKERKILIICPKASAMMRTMSLQDIYYGIESLKDEYDFWVHIADLADINDGFFCQNNGIGIIESCAVPTMLFNLWSADMVISTDSQAVHFREGIEKPALAIYSSFTPKSRTRYYEYTNSLYIKSDCDMQPCFLHEWRDGERKPYCPKGVGRKVAPCLNGSSFVEQVKEYIKNNQNYFYVE